MVLPTVDRTVLHPLIIDTLSPTDVSTGQSGPCNSSAEAFLSGHVGCMELIRTLSKPLPPWPLVYENSVAKLTEGKPFLEAWETWGCNYS